MSAVSPTPRSPGGDAFRSAVAGRRIIVGVGGGIAAYKVCTVVSALAQAGAEVTVAMTEGAGRFVTPLTFEALSGRAVYSGIWERIEHHDPQHIALSRAADAMLVAPCTMDLAARLAAGHADDIVTLLAASIDRGRTPVLLAPSMNDAMWNQPANQRNLRTLVEDGFRVIAPATGWQACRTVGVGRLPEPEALLEALTVALAEKPGTARST